MHSVTDSVLVTDSLVTDSLVTADKSLASRSGDSWRAFDARKERRMTSPVIWLAICDHSRALSLFQRDSSRETSESFKSTHRPTGLPMHWSHYGVKRLFEPLSLFERPSLKFWVWKSLNDFRSGKYTKPVESQHSQKAARLMCVIEMAWNRQTYSVFCLTVNFTLIIMSTLIVYGVNWRSGLWRESEE